MDLSSLSLPDTGVVAIIGSQWGDEGKGKIVDLLATEWADLAARGTGGANAGHTICIDNKSHVFHLMPSGILSGKTNVIGSGVALDPFVMLAEMATLDDFDVPYTNLKISRDAHLVLPQHIVLDRARERMSGNGKIGTTGRGIGYVYADHVARYGLKVRDMLNPDSFRTKLTRNRAWHIHNLMEPAAKQVVKEDNVLRNLATEEGILDLDRICAAYLEFGKRLRNYIADTDTLMRQAVDNGERVLLEGAQATLLSIDHGAYPMVTSSDSTVAGLAKGVGLRESQIDLCLAIVKGPYMSKVGGGNFPTKLGKADEPATMTNPCVNSDNTAEQGLAIRQAGDEYGATTGRPRDVGWLDLPLLRYALQFGGDQLVLTKADVLGECRIIKVCTHYIYQGLNGAAYDLGDRVLQPGDQIDVAFGDNELLGCMEAQYQEFPGWLCDISTTKTFTDLPAELREIITFIEGAVGSQFNIVSVGPDREQTVLC